MIKLDGDVKEYSKKHNNGAAYSPKEVSKLFREARFRGHVIVQRKEPETK